MQIPDEIRKCVVFLCYNTSEGMKFLGTAFFVEEIGEHKIRFVHLVTAKHILANIWDMNSEERIYLRVNLKSGQRDFVDTTRSNWIFHSDERIDIAILPCIKIPDDMDVDYVPYPLVSSLNDEIIYRECIGIGDEVFLPGLFAEHAGRGRNIPIIRTGNIAAMPDEQVETQLGMMDAYLVESRSIGGLSGSPVFVHLGSVRVFQSAPKVWSKDIEKEVDISGESYLLGVMHGHWDAFESNLDTFVDSRGNKQSINMGIAIVIPISKAIEAINQPVVDGLKDMEIKLRIEKRLDNTG